MEFDPNECTSIVCKKPATHTLTMNVHYDDRDEFTSEIKYCLDDVLYFAAWLPYCYPGKYELVSITPPAKELFETREEETNGTV